MKQRPKSVAKGGIGLLGPCGPRNEDAREAVVGQIGPGLGPGPRLWHMLRRGRRWWRLKSGGNGSIWVQRLVSLGPIYEEFHGYGGCGANHDEHKLYVSELGTWEPWWALVGLGVDKNPKPGATCPTRVPMLMTLKDCGVVDDRRNKNWIFCLDFFTKLRDADFRRSAVYLTIRNCEENSRYFWFPLYILISSFF